MPKVVKQVMGRSEVKVVKVSTRQKGRKSRKHGRAKAKCQRYRLLGKREKNKARRQKKHQKRIEKKIRKRNAR